MSFCHIHGSHCSSDGCPSCKDAEKANQERLDDIASRLEGASWDSGDYFCPHCRYKCLRRNATRCPVCHGRLGPEEWAQIDAKQERYRLLEIEKLQEQAKKQEYLEREKAVHAAVALRLSLERERK